MNNSADKKHHILSISGGKDSTALAFFIKENMPDIFEQLEFVFFDTECELPETYEYLNKIEVHIGKPVKRLKPYRGFRHSFSIHRRLPSVVSRWCTIQMKIETFKKYIHDILVQDENAIIHSYIGIRADEPDRVENYKNKVSSMQHDRVKSQFPLYDNGLTMADVHSILIKNGIGYPAYYTWRSRSGCTFCPMQRKIEWAGLWIHHPDLYLEAEEYEKEAKDGFTWMSDIALKEFRQPENIAKVQSAHAERLSKIKPEEKHLVDIFSEEFDEAVCPYCHL